MRLLFKYLIYSILILELLIYIYIQSNNVSDIPVINNINNTLVNSFYRKLIGHFLYNLIVSITLFFCLYSIKTNKEYLPINILYLGLSFSILFEIVQIIPSDRVFSINDIFINYLPYLIITFIILLARLLKFHHIFN